MEIFLKIVDIVSEKSGKQIDVEGSKNISQSKGVKITSKTRGEINKRESGGDYYLELEGAASFASTKK